MNKQDMNKEFIKDKFDNDGVHAPESLSEANMLAKIKAQDQSQDLAQNSNHLDSQNRQSVQIRPGAQNGRRTVMRRLTTIAACLLLVVVSVPTIYQYVTAPPDTSATDGDFHSFESYSEIQKLVKSINSDGSSFGFLKGLGNSGSTDDLVEYEIYDSSSTSSSNKSTIGSSDDAVNGLGGSYSETYLQVDGVDEADIIKTDGKYIYYVNGKQEVIILEANDGNTEQLSTIGYGETENYVDDIFLKDDLLVTVGWVYDSNSSEGYTGVITYDISDRSNPVIVNTFKQTGRVVSSRMVGNYVYLVTNDWVGYEDRYVPKVSINGEYGDMPLEYICCVPNPTSSTYTIVSAIDITSGDSNKTSKSQSRAVFGSTDTIYCNDHALYAAITNWSTSNGTSTTTLLRCTFDGLSVKFDKTATVDGYVNDQFSMDESNGYFRIATTASRNNMDVNNLYILDSKLNTVGTVSGFARDESIKSVRFMGDKAYVITYEEIDPLFVIDVSDPENPQIEGEVKIDGFSSLLVPVGKDRILGIGYATGDNGYGGEYASGLKLALFDVSDPSEPKVLDSKEFKDMESPAQVTHLALIVNKVNEDEYWLAIPYFVSSYTDEVVIEDEIDPEPGVESDDESDSDDGFYEEGGVLRFSADDQINILDQKKLSDDYLKRCVYIGDYIYALNYDGYVYSYKAE